MPWRRGGEVWVEVMFIVYFTSWVVGGCSFQWRTIVDWLAVASKTPPSLHICTSPWPNPLLTAWMRISISIHSVSTKFATRSVLSMLLPPARIPRAWLMPNGTKSPMIARPEAFNSGRPGNRAHNAEFPVPGALGNSVIGRALASRMSIRDEMVP